MEQLIRGHELLALDVDRLHLVVTSPDGALPEGRMRAVINRELLDLCVTLEQHFAVEEAIMESSALARGRPEAGALVTLRSGHRRILGQLRHLAAAASDLPIDVLKLRISDALDLLGEHEVSECGHLARGQPAQRGSAPQSDDG